MGVAELPDVGPMARFEEMIADPFAMSVVVQRVTDGETLAQIAKSRGVPYGKLAEWITEDAGRCEQYARATRLAMDLIAREVVAIADEAGETKVGVSKAKLRVDTRMRLAGKLYREQYGDASQVSVQVKDDRMLDPATRLLEGARVVAFLMTEGARIAERSVAAIEAPKQEPLPPALTSSPEEPLI